MDAAYIEKEDQLFDETYGVIKKYILESMTSVVGSDVARIDKMLDHTCKGGKMTRGKTVSRVVRLHTSAKRQGSGSAGAASAGSQRLLSMIPIGSVSQWVGSMQWSIPERLKKLPLISRGVSWIGGGSNDDLESVSRVVGWCIEILQAHFLVLDDIMDFSETRRGMPCWYKLPDVGSSMGINDGSLLRSFIFQILNRFVGHLPCFNTIMQLFLTISFYTECGQMLDVLPMPPNQTNPVADYNLFTDDYYIRVVRHKTAYYTFYLPLAAGLALTGDLNTTVPEQPLKDICMLIGEYFQINDDWLDCTGDPKVIGKIGTDIQDSKCSWLAVQFLKHASPAQKEEFKANYGKHDDDCVARIKKLYTDIQMDKIYAECEANYAKRVEEAMAPFAKTCPVLHRALVQLWKVTYKRSK